MGSNLSQGFVVNTYKNSDGDDLGVTIKGKTKLFLDAHQSLKNFMTLSKLEKLDDTKFKVANVSKLKGRQNVTIEVENDNDEDKGGAELIIHNPSIQKNKGATIEIRKLSGFEFKHVEMLKEVIILLLNRFIKRDLSKNESMISCEI